MSATIINPSWRGGGLAVLMLDCQPRSYEFSFRSVLCARSLGSLSPTEKWVPGRLESSMSGLELKYGQTSISEWLRSVIRNDTLVENDIIYARQFTQMAYTSIAYAQSLAPLSCWLHGLGLHNVYHVYEKYAHTKRAMFWRVLSRICWMWFLKPKLVSVVLSSTVSLLLRAQRVRIDIDAI